MAYVRRKANRPHPVQLLARDLDSMPVREFIRREIWNVLRQAVLVSMPEPRSMPGSGKPRPPLKIVPRDDEPGEGEDGPEGVGVGFAHRVDEAQILGRRRACG